MIQETGSDPLNRPRRLSEMKQGDYVAYAGANGCQNNGIDTTGKSSAESKNSCLGWNANQSENTNGSYGYCYEYSYKTTGWRIAYTEDDRAYLVSAGAPECNILKKSAGNVEHINLLNENAKKYCNSDFVDGDCSDNSDSWALNDTDFYKMTNIMNNGEAYHLNGFYGEPNCYARSSKECGRENNLLDNGGLYWFAASLGNDNDYAVDWNGINKMVSYYITEHAFGLRPVIRLSSSVSITGGNGTMEDPYTIKN